MRLTGGSQDVYRCLTLVRLLWLSRSLHLMQRGHLVDDICLSVVDSQQQTRQTPLSFLD